MRMGPKAKPPVTLSVSLLQHLKIDAERSPSSRTMIFSLQGPAVISTGRKHYLGMYRSFGSPTQ